MTYYSTCLNCAVDKTTCAKRIAISSGIKGLGITSAKFRCAARVSRFKPGQRVEFDWRYYADDGSNEGYTTTFVGTVMHEKAGNKRFAVRVDQDGEYYDFKPADILKNAEFISVRPDDMRLLDEPDRVICPLCARYDEGDGERERCWGYGDLSNVAGLGACHDRPPLQMVH